MSKPAPAAPPPLTHAYEGDVVVFNIGMTIHALHRLDVWMPVAAAMPKMLTELYRNRAAADRGESDDLGFLGAASHLTRKGPATVQYWKSSEQLYAYAHDTTAAHLPAWRAFNRAARAHPGVVGVWHETFVVPAENIETIYVNGAVVGLGAMTGLVPVERRGRTARERLSRGGRLPAAL